MLCEELEEQGVATLARPKQPARPLTYSRIHSILSNRYYVGTVTFGGAAYVGKHKPLVSEELWSRVEAVRQGRGHSKEKPSVRTHYLKGSLFCGQCGEALTYEVTRNRLGNYYEYFYCLGRQVRNGCSFVAIQAHHAETLVEDHWQSITFTDATLRRVRELVLHHIDAALPHRASSLKEAELALADAAARSDRLMQAYYAGAIDVETLRKEQDRIRASKLAAERCIKDASLAEDKIRRALDTSLHVLHRGHSQYVVATDQSRRDLNQAVFERIYLDDDEVVEDRRRAVYDYLLDEQLEERLSAEASEVTAVAATATPASTTHPSGVLRAKLVDRTGSETSKNPRPEDGGSNVTIGRGDRI